MSLEIEDGSIVQAGYYVQGTMFLRSKLNNLGPSWRSRPPWEVMPQIGNPPGVSWNTLPPRSASAVGCRLSDPLKFVTAQNKNGSSRYGLNYDQVLLAQSGDEFGSRDERRRWWDVLIVTLATCLFVWLGCNAMVPPLTMSLRWIVALSAHTHSLVCRRWMGPLAPNSILLKRGAGPDVKYKNPLIAPDLCAMSGFRGYGRMVKLPEAIPLSKYLVPKWPTATVWMVSVAETVIGPVYWMGEPPLTA